MPEHPSVYIGDGVYASFDGFQIWLRAGRHDADPVIAIEPEVWIALSQFAARVWTLPTKINELPTPGGNL